MIVGLRSAPNGFFKFGLPYSDSELFRLIEKTAQLGFACFQVGPLSDYKSIDCVYLKAQLDHYKLGRSVHIGGLYDAKKLALSETEYKRIQKEIHSGIEFCKKSPPTYCLFIPLCFWKTLLMRLSFIKQECAF